MEMLLINKTCKEEVYQGAIETRFGLCFVLARVDMKIGIVTQLIGHIMEGTTLKPINELQYQHVKSMVLNYLDDMIEPTIEFVG